jgi:hypothetical protein
LTGIGMEFDNAARRLQVLADVQGQWSGAPGPWPRPESPTPNQTK